MEKSDSQIVFDWECLGKMISDNLGMIFQSRKDILD